MTHVCVSQPCQNRLSLFGVLTVHYIKQCWLLSSALNLLLNLIGYVSVKEWRITVALIEMRCVYLVFQVEWNIDLNKNDIVNRSKIEHHLRHENTAKIRFYYMKICSYICKYFWKLKTMKNVYSIMSIVRTNCQIGLMSKNRTNIQEASE